MGSIICSFDSIKAQTVEYIFNELSIWNSQDCSFEISLEQKIIVWSKKQRRPKLKEQDIVFIKKLFKVSEASAVKVEKRTLTLYFEKRVNPFETHDMVVPLLLSTLAGEEIPSSEENCSSLYI